MFLTKLANILNFICQICNFSPPLVERVLSVRVGHPNSNEHLFSAFLYAECAYSECEPQGNVSDMHASVRDIVAFGNSDICALRK